MLEDLEAFWAEFDLQGLWSPTSPEHFLMNLGLVAALALVGYIALRALKTLF